MRTRGQRLLCGSGSSGSQVWGRCFAILFGVVALFRLHGPNRSDRARAIIGIVLGALGGLVAFVVWMLMLSPPLWTLPEIGVWF
jgi:hypothetical protein